MKRWIGLALILVPILAPAAAFWDGNAALQRGDASFEAGMFGAYNSFAPGAVVVVQNLETGKTATVTITGRVAGPSDILVLLSPTAAAALGIKAGTLASVRLTLASRAAASAASSLAEQTASQDPDLNPAVAYGGPTTGAAPAGGGPVAAAAASEEPTPSEESLPPAQAPAAAAETVPPATELEAPSVETPPAAAAQQTAEEQKAAEDAAILAEASSRIPQKKVFLPPREDKTFAYVPPAPTPPAQTAATAATTTATQAAPPAEPQITAVIGEPGVTPPQAAQENLALAEAAAPQESAPQEIVGAEAPQPTQAPEAAAVALAEPEPVGEEKPAAATTEAGPPVQTEVTGPVAVPPVSQPAAVALLSPEPPAPASESPVVAAAQATTQQSSAATATVIPTAPVATSTPRPAGDTWYVQLAAYATEKGAQDLAAKLSVTYPTQVIAPATTGAPFRVVVGPLNRAESGTLLVWFRFRGFPDAFVRQE